MTLDPAAIEAAVLAAAGSPWIYPAVLAAVLLDAFLVIVPSETIVVALGTLTAAGDGPHMGLLVLVAALGAVLGDSLTYALGRVVGADRFRWMRARPIARLVGYARRSLEQRAAVLVLTARYIPFARIAVNLTAGATGFPYRRILPLSGLAGLCWALFNVGVGALLGTWLGEQPLLAVLASVVVAIALGVLVDASVGRWSRRRGLARAVE